MDDPLPAVPDSGHTEYSVHNFCSETETAFGGKLFGGTLYFDIYRNGLLCRQHIECGSNNFWLMVRNVFNLKI